MVLHARQNFVRLLLPALLFWSAPATAQDPMGAVRANRWAEAEAATTGYADPVARKLVTYYRLQAPNAASAAEIAAFMAENPDWPSQTLLERRRQEALASEPDGPFLREQCLPALTQIPALTHCAEFLARTGDRAGAAALAGKAWISGLTEAKAEKEFLARWSPVLSADDQWARFKALPASDAQAGIRQAARLDAARRPLAMAILALRHDEKNADALRAALPAAQRDDPLLFLEQARALRRAGADAEALALWQAQGAAAEAALADRGEDFWSERHLLARRRLRDGDDAGAYALASVHGKLAVETLVNAEFFAGFVALQGLHDPARAIRHFRTLAAASPSALTQSRAQYWLGRAEAVAGRDPKPAYERYAAWPLTFYGQLAALALGEGEAGLAERIAALRDPGWNHEQVLNFAGREVVRAAALLIAWGETRRAITFLFRMDEIAPETADRALAARLVTALGMPELAVTIARRMGRDGMMLPEAGWPIPVTPPVGAISPPVTLALIRQESNFDIAALSPVGARGLMQLMPATAQTVARRIGERTSPAALTGDPAQNMRLGTAYLQGMLEQFGALPLAFAAYNAGPSRVQEWLAANGDPRATGIEMVDWIELIPFNETRNYVQRVLENVVVYRVRSGESPPTLLAEWKR
jgi:soluble lytic murein transglycosylase